MKRRKHPLDHLADDIRDHIDRETEDNIALGMEPSEARAAALRKFGNVTRATENTRAVWAVEWLEQFRQDLSYALRTMAGNRMFTAMVVVSLALGIGANVAIFSFLDTLLLRPLPVRDPDSLVSLHWHTRTTAWPEFTIRGQGVFYRDEGGLTGINLPFAAYELFRGQDQFFSSVAAHTSTGADDLNVVIDGEARMQAGQRVSGNFFETLGVPPAVGRWIQPADDQPGAPLVTVVSHAMWRNRLGGSSDAIGRQIRINNHIVTVIGVAPPGFRGPGFAMFEKGRDLYLPLYTPALVDLVLLQANNDPRYTDPNHYWVELLARLRPGVYREQAEQALNPLFQQFIQGSEPGGKQVALPLLMAKHGGRGSPGLQLNYGQQVWILTILVSLILAIACANVANLLLARGAARQRELAVRLSVGASRGRVIRQLLTESVLLSVLGGAGGIAVAFWGIRFLTALLSNGRGNFLLDPDLNWRVLSVAVAVSIATGLLFGLAPALKAARVDVFPILKGARIAAAPRKGRVQLSHILVAGQISISIALLMAAGLFVRTLINVRLQSVGFDPRNVLLATTELNIAGYMGDDAAKIRLYGDLRSRLASLPGVRAVSESEVSMFLNLRRSLAIRVPGVETPKVTTFGNGIGPRFLSTMGVPLLLGREIDERDVTGARPVAVINEAFAQTYFPGKNPLGQHFNYVVNEKTVRDYEIVGVVGNVRTYSLKRETVPYLWLPYTADTRFIYGMTFAIRTEGDPLRLANAVRRVARDIDEHLPLTIETQQHQLEAASRDEEMFATLAGGFAALALVIACVGLYATVAYNVNRRTNEIGIRMALGARGGSVLWMIVRQVFVMAVAGLAVGVPATLLAGRFIKSFIYGLEPHDPATMAWTIAILLVAVTIAASIPARRASRIDPMVALRHE